MVLFLIQNDEVNLLANVYSYILKGKRDKKGRGGLESVTCAGAGQVVTEMLRLCTPVSRN